MKNKSTLYTLFLFLFALIPSQLLAKDIITSTPVTYMLASQLMQGTTITTAYIAPPRYGVSRLSHWYAGKGEVIASQAGEKATVAITLNALWQQDLLFSYARQGNIKLIEIDASQSISPRAKGIATIQLASGELSLYAWLNPNNISTMVSIVGQDLQRVWPEHALIIKKNQQDLLLRVRSLINQQQQKLFDKEIDSVILLSEQLEDFAAANQLFVVERLVSEELEWSDQEKSALQSLVRESPEVWLLTTRKISNQLTVLLPGFSNILIVDSIDRWGTKGIDPDKPLQRWLF